MKRILQESGTVRLIEEALSDDSTVYNVECYTETAGDEGMEFGCTSRAVAEGLYELLADETMVASIVAT